MKIAVLGNGQLGTELYNSLVQSYQCKMFGYPQFDILSIDTTKIVKEYDVIINCVANTNVDKIQSQRDERKNSIHVNASAVLSLSILCQMYQKRLIHISTDYVYGSNGDEVLNQNSPVNPINGYGHDKLLGQQAVLERDQNKQHLVLRVSWLFGKYGKNNFIQKLTYNLLNNQSIKVVDDQIGNITSTKLVIKVIKQYLNGNVPPGLYNVQNGGQYVSRYDIASYLKQCLNTNCQIVRCKTSDFVLPAQRPLNSRLDTSKISQYVEMTNWKQQLKQYLEETK